MKSRAWVRSPAAGASAGLLTATLIAFRGPQRGYGRISHPTHQNRRQDCEKRARLREKLPALVSAPGGSPGRAAVLGRQPGEGAAAVQRIQGVVVLDVVAPERGTLGR